MGKKEQDFEGLKNLRDKVECSLSSILSLWQDTLIFIFDSEGRFKFVHIPDNDRLLFRPEEFLNRKFTEVMPDNLTQQFNGVLKQVLNGEPAEMEYSLDLDDNQRWFRARFAPLNEDEQITGCIAVVREITEWKHTEALALEHEENYRKFVERAQDGIAVILDEKLVYINLAMTLISQYNASELIGSIYFNHIHEEDRERVRKIYTDRINGLESPSVYEAKLIRKDGAVIWGEMNAGLITMDGETVDLVVIRDITGRKKTEDHMKKTRIDLETRIKEIRKADERIKHLNQMLRAIRNVNQLITLEKDRQNLLDGTCGSLVETRGYRDVWMLVQDSEGRFETSAYAGFGGHSQTFASDLSRYRTSPCIVKSLKTEGVWVSDRARTGCNDCPMVRSSKEDKYTMGIRLDHEGRIFGTLTATCLGSVAPDLEEQSLFSEVANDIAFALYNIEQEEARKRVERNLQLSENRYRSLSDNVPVALFRSDPEEDGTFVSANPTMARMFGYDSVESLMAHTTSTIFPDETQRSALLEEIARTGSVEDYTILMKRMDGSTFWASIFARPYYSDEEITDSYMIDGIISDITDRVTSARELKDSMIKLRKAINGTVSSMGRLVDMKDPYTSGHQKDVSELACAIAAEMGLEQNLIDSLKIAGALHDIGKLSIPSEILSKPGPMNDLELALMKTHPRAGYDILKTIEFPWPVADIVLQHHERLDGSGYPIGLKGDEIRLEARILAVADVIEATSSHRPYRASQGITTALEHIKENAGILYDPEIVKHCLCLFREKDYRFKKLNTEKKDNTDIFF